MHKEIGGKAALKMLVKLSKGWNNWTENVSDKGVVFLSVVCVLAYLTF